MLVRWLKSFAGEQGFLERGVPTDILRGRNIVLGAILLRCSLCVNLRDLGTSPPFSSLEKTLWGGGHLNFSWPSAAEKKTARRFQGTHQSLSEFVERVLFVCLFVWTVFYVKDD